MKYHPDKNPGDESAADYYKKINRAYEVLSNDEKRQVFDNGGEDNLERYE
jgi:DnaJ-class molecular chaperone